jgi:elongation factor Ts
MIDIEKIKELREETGVSISECKKALEETNGDQEKAKDLLRKWGKKIADKRAGKAASNGIIETYVHPNKKTAVMLEMRCESDFVAKSDDFKNLAHEICLQIAAMKPLFANEEDIPADVLQKEKDICLEQAKSSGKPEAILKGIVEGKIKKYKEEACLFYQPWIKDDSKRISDLIEGTIAKLGEKIIIKRFARFEI